MKKDLIEQLEYFEGHLSHNAIDNYNYLWDIINSADPYLYHVLDRVVKEGLDTILDDDIQEHLRENTESLSTMLIFIGDTKPDDIYLLRNGNLENLTERNFEILINDLITTLNDY